MFIEKTNTVFSFIDHGHEHLERGRRGMLSQERMEKNKS